MQRVRIRYSGRVQGVGFRVTAVSVARGRAVTGWVRNEPDGSVRLEAQGAPDELDRFLDAVAGAMGGLITDADRTPIPCIDGEQEFRIAGRSRDAGSL